MRSPAPPPHGTLPLRSVRPLGSWHGELCVCDLQSGNTARRFVGQGVLSDSFSVDNHQIVPASRDLTIKLWNALGECKYTIQQSEAHSEWVSGVRFSPNNWQPTVVSASWERSVKIWNLKNCELRSDLLGHTGYVNTVMFLLTVLFALADAKID
ncbi:unnamed protein product [Cuscuta europaea]|uniref:Peroxin-7 n=1 Tax=Cuscuta europaea TaxID=41803 RepID=A0A9P1EGJ4_CUSEU|nr:unnamed protein product [Cuscuta europaea]